MDKSPDAFRSIGEVSRLVGVAPHVLRYWETQFSQLSPVKRGDGRRYYRPDDVRLVAGLCQVLREEGLSIRGAKRLIAADRGNGLRQMGALRLGEQPATAHIEPTVDVTRASARKRKMPAANGSLPLFADHPATQPAHWLEKLTLTARRLRQHEAAQKPLPRDVLALRNALRAAR